MESLFKDEKLNTYSDEYLVWQIFDSPSVEGKRCIFRLSSHLIAKKHDHNVVEDAASAMELAHGLNIRVPRMKRIVVAKGDTFGIMDRIEGDTLQDAWPQLSCLETIKIALQLRQYIQSLRSVTSFTAGSLVSRLCKSFYLRDQFGLPFQSGPKNVRSFLRFWTKFTSISKEFKPAAQSITAPSIEEYVPSVPDIFVLTHHDLAPRNMIVDPTGQLWLIDWDYAGFYPTSFEYAAMQNFQVPTDWSWLARLRWNVFSWVAAGRFERDRIALESIRSKCIQYPAGRKVEILMGDAPGRKPAYKEE